MKGLGTIAAIESWEYNNSDVANGDISEEEMSLLALQISNLKNSYARKFKVKRWSDGEYEELSDLLYAAAQLNGAHEACVKFRDESGYYAFNRSFGRHQRNIKKTMDKQIQGTAECYGLSSEELSVVKDEEQQKYSKSNEAIMMQLEVTMALTGQTDEQEFVDKCNLVSQHFSLSNESLKDQRINAKTCKFK